MIPAFRRNAGFSLIELSVVVTIASLLAVAAMTEFRTWRETKIAADTESRKNIISNAFTIFLTNFGRLPCPADPALSPAAGTAGYEACPSIYGGDPTSINPLQRNGDVIRVAGMRDTLKDGNPTTLEACTPGVAAAGGGCDPVLIGTVPFAALGISAVDATDGWGNKLTYAVSEYMTNSNPNRGGIFPLGAAPIFDDQAGVIRINETVPEQIGGNYTGNFVGGGPQNKVNNDHNPQQTNTFMLVVLSHGADGKGAYTYSGRLNSACPATTVAYDAENCNGDAIFLSANKTTQVFNRKLGPRFFDDAYTIYSIRRDGDKWTAIGASSMTNKTAGRVGIGTALPQKTLDVGGNIKLENFQASQYCSNTPDPLNPGSTYCFKPSMLAAAINDADPNTSSAHCGTSVLPQLMTGINGAATWKTNCMTKMNVTAITPGSCPAGQYMTGIDATGAITCALP